MAGRVAYFIVVAQVDLKTEIDTNAALYLTVVKGHEMFIEK